MPGVTGRILLATPVRLLLLWLQLRTRAIDDIATDFARSGGRQILLLGAGFDCRAIRLGPRLADVRFVEVDHPATQAKKRAVLQSAQISGNAAYLAWDFERDPIKAFPARVEAQGLALAQPTLTIWEGVIPYLSEPAVETTLSALRAFGSDGSRVVLNYIERRCIERGAAWHTLVARMGEPLRFGWNPAELPAWLSARGFQWLGDRDDQELARALFSGRWRNTFPARGGRIALAKPA